MPERPVLTTAPCWICGAAARPDRLLAGEGYLRCLRCGLLFQGWRAPGEAAGLYDESYFECYAGGGGYADDHPQRSYEARQQFRFLRRFARAGRLLEIGSAGGYFLDRARRAGFHVRGIEPVEGMARASARRFALDIEHATVEEAALGDGEWDVICAFHVLEHLQDPLLALTKLRTALAAGGILLLEVPNVESAFARRRGSGWFNLQPSHHVAHYGPDSLRAALDLSGYSVLSATTVSHFEYMRTRNAFRIASLVDVAALLVASRRLPMRQHADRHEFLRMVAVK